MKRKWIVAGLLLVAISSSADAQDSGTHITSNEAREAERIARSFASRLEESKDLAPLIEEFFAPNFPVGYLEDSKTNRHLLLRRDVARTASHNELLRYYVLTRNAAYLNAVYIRSKYPSMTYSQGIDLSSRRVLSILSLSYYRTVRPRTTY